jgi:hypothetical protein
MEARSLTLVIEDHGSRVDHVVHDARDGREHYVTGLSCDCEQFARHGTCAHHALLLESLGWPVGERIAKARAIWRSAMQRRDELLAARAESNMPLAGEEEAQS